jgi:hypothetical protein
MSIINSSLLTPRNIVVITLITTVAHFVAAPLYKLVGNKKEEA